MLRAFYTLVFLVSLPFIFARLWWKEKKVPGYRIRWLQRLGVFQRLVTDKPVIWVHAVSVGEVIAAAPIIDRLLREGKATLMVTTMTPTGSDRVAAAFGSQVAHVYAPFDLPWTVSAFIRRTRPVLTIIMETELWPNMMVACARNNIPMILANARLSSRSARRYGYFSKTTKYFFNLLTCVAVQNRADGERFIKLGIKPNKLTVIGSVKFDIQISARQKLAAQQLKIKYSAGGKRPVVVAASTHEGEECAILNVWAKVLRKQPEALLVIVPRHPERFDEIVALSSKKYKTIRRSTRQVPDQSVQVIIGDTMGELMVLYGVSDIGFVGGSLIERGGHNMIEPATWGLPIITGPHTFNFEDICQRLEATEGICVVPNAMGFADSVIALLGDDQERSRLGQNALAFTGKNRGAIAKLMTVVNQLLPTEQ